MTFKQKEVLKAKDETSDMACPDATRSLHGRSLIPASVSHCCSVDDIRSFLH